MMSNHALNSIRALNGN